MAVCRSRELAWGLERRRLDAQRDVSLSDLYLAGFGRAGAGPALLRRSTRSALACRRIILKNTGKARRSRSPDNWGGELPGSWRGDDNAHYQGTEALINELVAANKQFSMMAIRIVRTVSMKAKARHVTCLGFTSF